MTTLWYRIEVEDNDSGYDLEAIIDVGLDECGLHGSKIFKIVAIEAEDVDG